MPEQQSPSPQGFTVILRVQGRLFLCVSGMGLALGLVGTKSSMARKLENDDVGASRSHLHMFFSAQPVWSSWKGDLGQVALLPKALQWLLTSTGIKPRLYQRLRPQEECHRHQPSNLPVASFLPCHALLPPYGPLLLLLHAKQADFYLAFPSSWNILPLDSSMVPPFISFRYLLKLFPTKAKPDHTI